jgi:hypothetical protein
LIKTLLRVDEKYIQTKGHAVAFVEKLVEWESTLWVKYLREHGKIVTVESYKDISMYTDTYKITWELPAEKETWFYLQFGEDYNNIKRLT